RRRRARRHAIRPGPRHAASSATIRYGAPRRHLKSHLRHRYRQSFLAQRFPPGSIAARHRSAPDRRVRAASTHRDVRGTRAVLALAWRVVRLVENAGPGIVSFPWLFGPDRHLGGPATPKANSRLASSIGHNHGLFDE